MIRMSIRDGTVRGWISLRRRCRGVVEGTYCGCLTAVTALEKGLEAAVRLLLGYCLVTAFQTREKQGLSWSKAIVSGVTIRLSTLRVVTPSHYVSQVQF